ncbi:rhodanese-like domain-containing protein [Streptomyces halstedii]|uniref:rhodanese-like domain-containing protein n=1 Tax=Streptomyces TaxID=1883 RepID=UPI0004A90094|nr:rhodanese-like domain-containing protein [Streptomyces sp. NTK 937]KDQ70264.1 sulfurtransferase [Streptomyces sp. NTK 937]WSX35305.1 rhodanese-like domain-containing protein [Streptomyces halstedii]
MSLFPLDKKRVSVEEADRRTLGVHAPDLPLDVRERGVWDAGHAPGAVHVPLSAPVAGAALPQAAQGRPPVVICRSGNRSRKAAELLRARGVDAVDVKGGIRQWAAAGHPVVGASGNEGSMA